MRLLPVLTALLVTAVLYLLILERDTLLAFARGEDASVEDVLDGPNQANATEQATPVAVADAARGDREKVRVIARASVAQEVDSAVILRGETAALRQVDVRAETSGQVVSEPLRKGAVVAAGDLLCRIDPGVRDVSLDEALAALSEAEARVPEADARLAEAEAALPAARARIAEAEAAVPAAEAALAEARASVPAAEARLREAEARVPEARARLIEAQARVPEAEARLAEAAAAITAAQSRLAEAQAAIPTAEARLREAQAAVPTALARLEEARARVPEAEARVAEAQARIDEAQINLTAAERLSEGGFASQTRLANARAAMSAARAQEQAAQSGLLAASAGVENAKGTLEGARAGVEAARGAVESAKAGVATANSNITGAKAAEQSAKSQVQNAAAGVQTARSGVENALAGVQSAKSQIEGARASVQSATSGVEGAKASVASATSQLETAQAGVQSAKSGIRNAQSGIQSAQAAVASARKEIERLDIHAPFDGLLESDTAELGALLQPGGLCATVIQLDPIKIVGFVPETEVARVEMGARAGARLVSGDEVIGTVDFLSRSADPTTRTFRVEVSVPNGEGRIRDGQTADILIEADGQMAHLLPQSALTLDDDGLLGVRIVDAAETAQFVEVALLRDTAEGVWVAGLPQEANVILVGQEYVIDGVPVAPSYEEVQQ